MEDEIVDELQGIMNELSRVADALETLSSCVYVIHTRQGDAKEFNIYIDGDDE